MTDYVITGGNSAQYPKDHFGAHYVGSRATYCLPKDLIVGLDANVQAIPTLQLSALGGAVKVPETFFGMHVWNRANDGLAGVSAKAVRSLGMVNGKSRWQFIQPVNDSNTANWDWADLDKWVDVNWRAGRDLVFVLYGTPQWASARPNEDNAFSSFVGGVYYNRGIAAEPTNMALWDAFCTAVATRYKGKIRYYEVWNEPNYQNDGTGTQGTKSFFTGTWAKLSEMVRRANQAIKAVDALAIIICPAVQGWGPTSGSSDTYFAGMMAASDGASGTMKDWVDIIGVHLYMPAPNRIQDLSGMIDRINACKTAASLSSLPTWDTESAPISPDISGLNDAQAITLMSRALLTIAVKSVARHFYYQYDIAGFGFINRPQVLAAWERMAALLRGGTIVNVYKFTDGRIAYATESGLTII